MPYGFYNETQDIDFVRNPVLLPHTGSMPRGWRS
jgi:hypothetical protein